MAIYSFVTTLTIPTDDEFDCVSFGPAHLDQILLFPETTINRGVPWIYATGGRLVVSSNDAVASTFRFDVPFKQTFTFETTVCPTLLPHDLTDLNHRRLFIGAFDKQDNAAGLLISKMGLAIVATYGNSVLPIPGSHNIFEEDVYYVLRVVVDGIDNKLDVYVTKLDEVAITGHQLRYTAPAPISPIDALDSIFINVCGIAEFPVEVHFATLRASCAKLLIPNQRPIADPGPDRTLNLGSVIRYDGSESYDPEGADLSYRWALIGTPENSRFVTSGTDGYGFDDGGPDDWTAIFYAGSGSFSVDNAPALQPGDYLTFDGVGYIVSTVGWRPLSGTTKYERDTGGTWPADSDRIFITEDALPKGGTAGPWKICHTMTYFSDPLYVMPTAIPDVPGLYEVRLTVNDGQLDSLPTNGLLNVSSVRLVLGCTPDLSWIWQYLSDFWRLVDGREAISTIWSGMAQAAAAQLMVSWQVDYNKSLIDIQRTLQRRWLDYDTVKAETAPDDATIRIIRGPIISSDVLAGPYLSGLTLQLVMDAGAVQTVTFTGTNPLTADQIVDQINEQMGYKTAVIKLARRVDVLHWLDPSIGATYGGIYGILYGIEGPPYSYIAEQYVVLEYGTLLQVRPGGTANPELGFSTETYTQNDLSGQEGKPVSAYNYEVYVPLLTDFDSEGIGAEDILVRNAEAYRIQKWARVNCIERADPRALALIDPMDEVLLTSWLIPSVVTSTTFDFTEELIRPGDIAQFMVTDTIGAAVMIECEVVGGVSSKLGFDPRPLLEKFNGAPGDYVTRFLGIKHIVQIPVSKYVTSIPRLQQIIKDPPNVLTENLEYSIQDVGNYRAIVFSKGLFSLADPPPDTFWGEVTYLDNRPTIEANFGRLVNFKVEDLSTRTDNLDYLSAVRGLWWAYFGGPSLYRVKVGTQILLGLPFAEAAGTVTEIETEFSALEGRILIRDRDDATITRSYFYPLKAGIGVVPETGETIKVGDFLNEFTPLSGGIEVKDWVSAQTWYINYVSTRNMLELDKFFRWLVRMDVDTFNLVNVSFAIDFIKKIKPHYTNPLVVLFKQLDTTEVDVDDYPHQTVRLNCWEHFDPLQCGAWRHDDVYGGGALRHHWDATLYADKFLYDRNRLSPILTCSAVIYVHMDGVHSFRWNDIWLYNNGGPPPGWSYDDIPPEQVFIITKTL